MQAEAAQARALAASRGDTSIRIQYPHTAYLCSEVYVSCGQFWGSIRILHTTNAKYPKSIQVSMSQPDPCFILCINTA